MKFERLDLNKPFYEQWKSKYWLGRQWYKIDSIIDNQFYLTCMGSSEMKRPEIGEWENLRNDGKDRQIIVELEWFRTREKNLRQPKEQ